MRAALPPLCPFASAFGCYTVGIDGFRWCCRDAAAARAASPTISWQRRKSAAMAPAAAAASSMPALPACLSACAVRLAAWLLLLCKATGRPACSFQKATHLSLWQLRYPSPEVKQVTSSFLPTACHLAGTTQQQPQGKTGAAPLPPAHPYPPTLHPAPPCSYKGDRQGPSFKRLPFTHCAISFQPFEDAVSRPAVPSWFPVVAHCLCLDAASVPCMLSGWPGFCRPTPPGAASACCRCAPQMAPAWTL